MFQKYRKIIFFSILSLISFFYTTERFWIEEGCTDIEAINFNPNANKLKDSCCVKILNTKVTKSMSKVNVLIDNSRYSNIKYEFIYKSKIKDTLKVYKSYPVSFTGRKKYLQLENIVSDTLRIEINSKNKYEKPPSYKIFSADNIKVRETISGRSKVYYIDVNDNKMTRLINPRRRNKYKTEEAKYSTVAFFNTEPNKKKRYRSFYNEIDDSIDYWFKDLPQNITITTTTRYSIGTSYRTNIKRY